jgi:hypothetical protein
VCHFEHPTLSFDVGLGNLRRTAKLYRGIRLDPLSAKLIKCSKLQVFRMDPNIEQDCFPPEILMNRIH